MVHETGKSMARRLHDSRFARHYYRGDGIDLGSGDDPLAKYASYFPLINNLRSWERVPDGDAMLMPGVHPATFDFINASHCLEHLANPVVALRKWIEICKVGGHLIIVVPDEELYEQGQWPSAFNADHKWSFSISKAPTGRPQSVSFMDLLVRFTHRVAILKIELLDAGYIYGAPVHDQSLSVACEPAIEIVLRKLPYG